VLDAGDDKLIDLARWAAVVRATKVAPAPIASLEMSKIGSGLP